MAFDKVIDSTQLDAAMTYTADRIRNKFQKWFDEPEKVIDRDAL